MHRSRRGPGNKHPSPCEYGGADATPGQCSCHRTPAWNGEVWLAAGAFGLVRRKGMSGELEVVKPNLRANGFGARESLVICCFDKVAGTSDGQSFSSVGAGGLLKARQGKELLDFS